MARLLALFVTAFVDMVGLVMIVPLLPFYAADFGANATMVGVLISAFSVAQLAVSPLWGRGSDHFGRRPMILAGLLLSAAAYIVFALANSITLLLASRVIQGVGGGTIGVVQAYVTDATAPQDRTKSLGWLSAVTSLGAVLGAPFGSALVAIGGRAAPGLAAAGLAAGTALFAWRFLQESRGMRASSAHASTIPPARMRDVFRTIVSRWGDPAPRLIWIYTVGIGAFYGTVQTVPLLLTERLDITARTVGYFFALLGAVGVIVRAFALGHLVDRLGEARLARWGIGLLAAGLALVALAHSFATMLGGFILMPLGTACLFPSITGLLSHEVPATERGMYLGIQQTFGGVSRVVFPVGAGVVMDAFNRGTPFWISGLLVLATLPLARGVTSYPRELMRSGGAAPR